MQNRGGLGRWDMYFCVHFHHGNNALLEYEALAIQYGSLAMVLPQCKNHMQALYSRLVTMEVNGRLRNAYLSSF